jgi:hypothetical protein
MEKIEETLALQKQMTLEQRVEYYETQKARVSPLASQVPLLTKSWQAFTVSYDGLVLVYKRAAASPLTPAVFANDYKRGNEFMFINNCVNNVLAHSTIAEEVAAAKVLEPEMKNHAGMQNKDYEGETAEADDLIDKCKAPEMVAALTRLGLVPHITAFELFNTDFKSGYRERLDQAHARRLTGTASKHSRETAVCFDAFCSDMTSLNRLLTDPAQLSVLAQMATSINAVTEQFRIIVDRHHHINASKGGGNSGGDGFQKPDTDNPSPFTPPDITNPPAPFE